MLFFQLTQPSAAKRGKIMRQTIRKTLIAVCICLLPSLGSATETPAVTAKTPEAPKQQQLRLAYIDIARVSSESAPGKAAATQIKQRQKTLHDRLTARKKRLDKQKADIEAQIAQTPPAERQAKAKEQSKEFQKQVVGFQKLAMSSEQELQALQEKVSKTFDESLRNAAKEYGEKNGFSLIVIKQEMLYLSGEIDAVDVTDAVIKIMGENKPKK